MKKYNMKRIVNMLSMRLINILPMNGQKRYRILKLGGVKVLGNQGLIGRNVTFDSIRPDMVILENGVYITDGCSILTHHMNTSSWKSKEGGWWRFGEVRICKDAFIGMRTIICNSVTIGECAIVGAGSIVTKDIPPYEIWGGNPAKFIKKR